MGQVRYSPSPLCTLGRVYLHKGTTIAQVTLTNKLLVTIQVQDLVIINGKLKLPLNKGAGDAQTTTYGFNTFYV